MKVNSIPEKQSGIYCILNKVNGKVYVGSSKNMRQRLYKHRYQLRRKLHENPHLQSSFSKYGEEQYYCFVLGFYPHELTKHEQFWIDTLKPEYNIALHVERVEHMPETRQRISEKLKQGYANGTVKRTRMRPVCSYHLSGDFIGEWDCMADAARETGVAMKTIFKVVSGLYNTCNGIVWRYKEDTRPMPAAHELSRAAPVILTDLFENTTTEFASSTAAALHIGCPKNGLSHHLKLGTPYKKRYIIAKVH